jgi:PAS domain S-box-containing protein
MHADALQVLTPAQPAGDPLWQHQLGLLLESTGEGIFGIDLAGHCVFINRAGARMLGFEPAEVLGHNMHELTHHSHADGSRYPDTDCPIFNAFRQGLPCRIDTEVFWRRDRTAFAVEYSSHPILDGAQVRGAVITFVDITERKRASDALHRVNGELARAKAELELRVAERTRELSAALTQQRELAAYSETVREEERTRIAREVHDELGSLLVAMKMDVNWLDKRLSEQPQRTSEAAQDMRERMRCKCQNMSRLIENAVDNVGRIITDLRPSILDHQGLWAALEWQAHEFVQSAELELEWDLQLEPSPDGPELPEPAAMAVFRIFQEMLSNVGRHAQASRIAVRIAADTERLRITVEDNGSGAAPEAFESPTAYGVMGMRERARHFGGHIAIASEIGHGSSFTLVLPLQDG